MHLVFVDFVPRARRDRLTRARAFRRARLVAFVLVSAGCARTGLDAAQTQQLTTGTAASACHGCADMAAECGTIDDGCNHLLACGACAAPLTCGGGGDANRCGCVPATCAAAGAECGETVDGCGGVLRCGECPPGEFCGGAGANRCGRTPCAPASCTALNADCGVIADGCSSVLACGTCSPPQSCGGSGVDHVCGCVRASCGALGAECGKLDDGCGGALDCGVCTPPAICGGGGVSNRCGCVPKTCADLGAHCGTLPDGCGGVLSCGSCSRYGRRGREGGRRVSVCIGIGPANCSEEGETCQPRTCESYGARCGMVADGCGGILQCGECAAPYTCGGGGIANQCGCTPRSCDAVGAGCGSMPDGCGGTIDCGACSS